MKAVFTSHQQEVVVLGLCSEVLEDTLFPVPLLYRGWTQGSDSRNGGDDTVTASQPWLPQ